MLIAAIFCKMILLLKKTSYLKLSILVHSFNIITQQVKVPKNVSKNKSPKLIRICEEQ